MSTLLELTQAALAKSIGDANEFGSETQPPAHMEGRRVVVPAYNDGYCVHKASVAWQSGCNGKFYAINCYGVRERFTRAADAAKFVVSV